MNKYDFSFAVLLTLWISGMFVWFTMRVDEQRELCVSNGLLYINGSCYAND